MRGAISGALRRAGLRGGTRRFQRFLGLPRQAGGEGAADARRALHRDVAAHQAAQAPADREPEAGAAVFARGRAVGLAELLEQPGHLLLAHADAGIGHHEGEEAVVVLLALDVQADLALVGELAGVAQQIEHHLADPGHVRAHAPDVVRAADREPVAVLLRERRCGHRQLVDQRLHVDVLEMQLEAPRFDLRQVEDLVDQLQEMVAGAANPAQRLDEVLLTQILGVLLQHLGDADHGVERRAQLMAHVGQELALGAGRLLGLLHGAAQLEFRMLEVGDVGVDRDDAAVMGVALGDLDPAAVGALLDQRLGRVAVARDPLGDPGVDPADRLADPTALGRAAHDRLERHAGLDRRGVARVEHLAVAVVAEHQAVGGIEQGEALRDALDRVGQPALQATDRGLRLLALRGQPLALRQGIPEQGQGARHGADLVAAGARYRGFEVAAGDLLGRMHQAPQGPGDRVDDQHRQRDAEDARQDDHGERDADRGLGIPQRRTALCVGLGLQARDQPAQQLVDRLDMQPGVGHERVADHPLVVGVGVDRLEGLGDQTVDLAADLPHLGRGIGRQRRSSVSSRWRASSALTSARPAG